MPRHPRLTRQLASRGAARRRRERRPPPLRPPALLPHRPEAEAELLGAAFLELGLELDVRRN